MKKNEDGSVELHIYVDKASVEVFSSNNTAAGANQIFPTPTSLGASVLVEGDPVKADIDIYPTVRPLSARGNMLSAYGSKMRIGTIGLTKHGLSSDDKAKAENAFIESKRSKYEDRYGDKAQEKLRHISISDKAYLIEGRDPIIIIHYLKPHAQHDFPNGYEEGKDLIVGYGIGFPKLSGSDPIYAVYYINTVEQRRYFEEEIEEDQMNGIDD